MSVVLNLRLTTPGSISPDDRSRSLTEGELRIGRDPDNGWVLEDDARLISRHHCTITARAGLFTLIDTSNNGVFINEGERPLGRGNSVILSEGDLLHFGVLTVQVSVTTRTDEPDAFRSLLPPLGAPANLGIGADEFAPKPLSSPRPSPMMAPMRRDASNFGIGGLESSGFGGGARDANAAETRSLGLPSSFDAMWSTPRAAFGDLPTVPLETPGTPSDHLPVQEEALPPMRISAQNIPDDWDLELDGPPADTAGSPVFVLTPTPPAPPPPPVAVPAPAAEPVPTPAVKGLLLSFIEALGVVEEAALPPGQPRILGGSPEEVLERLSQEDPDWVGLVLVSLSADVAARLSPAPSQAPAPDSSSLSLPERVTRPARYPGETSQ